MNIKNRRSDPDNSERGDWKNKFKKSIKMQSVISHVMYMMLEEEENNSYLVAALE